MRAQIASKAAATSSSRRTSKTVAIRSPAGTAWRAAPIGALYAAHKRRPSNWAPSPVSAASGTVTLSLGTDEPSEHDDRVRAEETDHDAEPRRPADHHRREPARRRRD